MSRALIHSNLYVALCATSMVWATRALHSLPISPFDALSALVFWATVLIYNLDRAAIPGHEDRHLARNAWYSAHRPHVAALCVLAAGFVVASAWHLPAHLAAALLPLGALSLGYSIPFARWRGRWLRLKDVPGLKIFLIASVWSMVTAGLPMLEAGRGWGDGALWWGLGERALFIFVITLPFDVRDLERDARAGVVTIPGALGVEATRRLAVAGACVWVALATQTHGLDWSPAFFVTAALVLGLLARLSADRGDAYYTVWMEGMMWAHAALVMTWGARWA